MAAPTLLYDDACPMCKAYTATFERVGWCDRRAFSRVGEEILPAGLDLDRARHEIPLIDPASGRVYYGLDAMTRVLASGLPRLQPILRSRALRLLLTPLYKIITYNRRPIAGTHAPATGFDCAPDRHVGWRLAYLLLLATVTGLIGLSEVPLIPLLLVGLVGLLLSRDRLDFCGQFVTLLFTLSVLLALLAPAFAPLVGMGFFGFTIRRRFY